MQNETHKVHAKFGPGTITIDLARLPQGKTYEDQYQGYLKLFHDIATVPPESRVVIKNAPWSWYPIFHMLSCDIMDCRVVFAHCKLVECMIKGFQMENWSPVRMLDRTAIEVMCGFRPECSDALWKIDMQWQAYRTRRFEPSREFIVTNNGSFHRQEVIEYMEHLNVYEPTKRKVVLVPCAADKPYPAPMHAAVKALLPDDYYMMAVTGVLGLIPEDLFGVMPWYDSAVPNRWRVFEQMKAYFSTHEHTRIVVYCDFYSVAIKAALDALALRERTCYVIEPQFYYDYLDLQDPKRLELLKTALTEFQGENYTTQFG